jgi:class 3 adenylate cyclase
MRARAIKPGVSPLSQRTPRARRARRLNRGRGRAILPRTARRRCAARRRLRRSSMVAASLREVVPPIPATAIIVDLRNFTPNLKAAPTDPAGVNTFCHFLAEFYARCLDASLTAILHGEREEPPLSMTSTGDGVLIIFTDPSRHFVHAFLTAMLLHSTLSRACDAYNVTLEHPGIPRTSFGIGLESGTVCRVRALASSGAREPIVDTFIGDCINVAARAQDVSKLLFQAHTIVAAQANELLCRLLFQESYASLMEQAVHPGLDDAARLRLYDRMTECNRTLCLTFVHQHVLKGVDRPLALFRVAETAVRQGSPRLDALLATLVGDHPTHLAEVRSVIRGTGPAPAR